MNFGRFHTSFPKLANHVPKVGDLIEGNNVDGNGRWNGWYLDRRIGLGFRRRKSR